MYTREHNRKLRDPGDVSPHEPLLNRGDLVYIAAMESLGVILKRIRGHRSHVVLGFDVYTKDKVCLALPVKWLERL